MESFWSLEAASLILFLLLILQSMNREKKTQKQQTTEFK